MTMLDFLQEKLEQTSNKLEEYVIKHYLEAAIEYDDVEVFMNDVISNGCVSGVIGTLIYYKDTNDFFDKYEDEIEELADELDSFGGVIMSILNVHNLCSMTELKNYLAWFGFEEITRKLLNEFENK